MKKIICGLLALMLVFSVLPVQSLAAQTEYVHVGGETVVTQQDRKWAGNSIFTLTAGEHVRWIDRVANAPKYAMDFYSWLEANAVEGGPLADPTVSTEKSGTDYYHTVTTVTGSDRFAYVSKAQISERAGELMAAARTKAYDYSRMAYHLFLRDHPEIFWLGTTTVCGAGGSYTYNISNGMVSLSYQMPILFYLKNNSFDIRIAEYCQPGALAMSVAMYEGAKADILARCPQTNAYEKVRYLNSELTRRNAYNSLVAGGNEAAASKTAWASITAMVGNTGTSGPVCTAYAKALQDLCTELKIPCVVVDGDAKGTAQGAPGSHMWNYVKIGNSWYGVDVTWNDPYVPTNTTSAVSGFESEKWLLLGADTQVADGWTFIQSHPVSNDTGGNKWTNGPKLASNTCPVVGVLKMVDGAWKYYVGDTFYPITNLVEFYNGLYLVQEGVVNFSSTGFIECDGLFYYFQNGVVPTNKALLVKNGDYWFYVNHGFVDYAYDGLVKHSGSWYYVKNGVMQPGISGLVKHSGQWYYVVQGKMASETTTLVKYNGEWFYVVNGKMASGTTNLVKYNGEWFYVVKGKVASATTDLIKYNGEWFYVVKGKVAGSTTTLVQYNGGWYYIYKGKLAAKTTTLVKYSGSWYYVKNGKVDFTYSGRFLFNGSYYNVKDGRVV